MMPRKKRLHVNTNLKPLYITIAVIIIETMIGYIRGCVISVSESIDLIYLWVNGSDPTFISRYNIAKGIVDYNYSKENFEIRFLEKNEFLISLRTVFQFLPWINKIHIVTNNQIPYWLNQSHPKFNFVNHDQIFVKKTETFNTNSIHFALNNIQDLANHFILADDDFFWTRPVEKSYYFEGDFPIYRVEKLTKTIKEEYKAAEKCVNNNDTTVFWKSMLNAWDLVSQNSAKPIPKFVYGHVAEPMNLGHVKHLINKYGLEWNRDMIFRNCSMIHYQSTMIYDHYVQGISKLKFDDFFAYFWEDCDQLMEQLMQNKPKGASYCLNHCKVEHYQQLLSMFPPCEFENGFKL